MPSVDTAKLPVYVLCPHSPPSMAVFAVCSHTKSSDYLPLAVKDANPMGETRDHLRKTWASPTVHQGGSGEFSRPIASGAGSDGSEQPSSVRSEGTPSTAESNSDADATIRSSSGLDSPSDSLLNFF